jgi:hypothetical protein
MAKSKRQMTAAKRAREQTLRERRIRKQEKKQARAEGLLPQAPESDEALQNGQTESDGAVENQQPEPR